MTDRASALRLRASSRAWSRDSSPFNAGEQRVQSRIGVRDQLERAGRNMIYEQMPDQHRQLFEALPLLVVGSLDSAGRPYASLLSGAPGFISSPTPKLLRIAANPAAGDPLAQSLVIGAKLGLLGIQLETRRRNRANGRIVARDASSFSVEVDQSFGNCKQYIQAREPEFDPALVPPLDALSTAAQAEGPYLSQRAHKQLEQADTFFIATASAAAAQRDNLDPSEGVDVSHRGGRPGFVLVERGPSATRLTVPDFRGNFMFNSFGNLELNPRAGIVCADFKTGDILSLTGQARVIWEGPEVEAFEGADRLLRFEVESGVILERALPLHFHGLAPSPDLLETGTWSEARVRIEPTSAR